MPAPKLKPTQKSVKVPTELIPCIKQRQKDEHYGSFQAYVLGLIVYDLSTRFKHRITANLLNDPPDVLESIIGGILRDFPTLPNIDGPWYEKMRKQMRADIITELRKLPPDEWA